MQNNEFIIIHGLWGLTELNGELTIKPSLFNNSKFIRYHTSINDLPNKAPIENSLPQSSQKTFKH